MVITQPDELSKQSITIVVTKIAVNSSCRNINDLNLSFCNSQSSYAPHTSKGYAMFEEAPRSAYESSHSNDYRIIINFKVNFESASQQNLWKESNYLRVEQLKSRHGASRSVSWLMTLLRAEHEASEACGWNGRGKGTFPHSIHLKCLALSKSRREQKSQPAVILCTCCFSCQWLSSYLKLALIPLWTLCHRTWHAWYTHNTSSYRFLRWLSSLVLTSSWLCQSYHGSLRLQARGHSDMRHE